MINEEEVLNRLRRVMDPEFDISVVEMNFIDDVKINDSEVEIKFHSIASRSHPFFVVGIGKQIREQVSGLRGVKNVEVKIQNHKMSEERSDIMYFNLSKDLFLILH